MSERDELSVYNIVPQDKSISNNSQIKIMNESRSNFSLKVDTKYKYG